MFSTGLPWAPCCCFVRCTRTMSDNLLMRSPAVLPCSKSNVSGFKIRKQVTDDQGAHILQIIWGVGSLHWRGVGGVGWLHFPGHRPRQLPSSGISFMSLHLRPGFLIFFELPNSTVLSKPVYLKDTTALRLGKDFSKK